jgi:hypothetical protein
MMNIKAFNRLTQKPGYTGIEYYCFCPKCGKENAFVITDDGDEMGLNPKCEHLDTWDEEFFGFHYGDSPEDKIQQQFEGAIEAWIQDLMTAEEIFKAVKASCQRQLDHNGPYPDILKAEIKACDAALKIRKER